MTPQEIDRVECAIRHIQTSLDVDPWACDIAVEAMKKQIPTKPTINVDVFNDNLCYLYCPTCETWIGMWNKRLKHIDMHNNTNRNLCVKCGQAILTDFMEGEQNGLSD